jgi:hypothetical protein
LFGFLYARNLLRFFSFCRRLLVKFGNFISFHTPLIKELGKREVFTTTSDDMAMTWREEKTES